jgi:hypothetical protein
LPDPTKDGVAGKSIIFRIRNLLLRSIHLGVLVATSKNALLSFDYQNGRLAQKVP